MVSLVAFVTCSSVLAQDNGSGEQSIDRRAKEYQRSAEQYLYEQDYESAIPLLKKAISRDSSYAKPYITLANIHFRRDSHRLRRNTLKTLIRERPDFPGPYFELGSDYYANGYYREAYKTFGQFLAFDGPDEKYLDLARKRRDTALFRAQQKANPVSFDPTSLGDAINTSFSEYWPVMTTDRQTMYFTRRLEQNAAGNRQLRRRTRRFNEEIYVSKRKEDGWREAKKPAGNLNSTRNEGAITIAPNGKYIIFTGCQWGDTRGRCDLYMARKRKGRWTTPRNLGRPVNTRAKETQPSISFDGQTLYFASDRGNSSRKLDIYRSQRQEDGSWGKPENLGKPINTDQTEQSPFIHADNKTLFFSSQGHMGMGSSDLFYARRKANGEFGEPQNLGYPINTKGEDIGLFVSSDGRTAYFASRKPEQGEGRLDLYRFQLPEKARAQAVTYLEGKIEDAITRQNLQAQVRIRDLSSGEVMVRTRSAKGTGRFMLPLHADHNYAVAVTRDGYLMHSENLSIKRYDSARPYDLDVELAPIKEGKQVELSNIFFEVDKHKLKSTSKAELRELAGFLEQNPNVVIEIQGHTDNQGSEAYNQQLSEKRAKAVYQHLVEKRGIDAKRLQYKGYGQSQPIASNEKESGRARNRRTTFEIISQRE